MLLGLLTALAIGPVYWLTVPIRWRRDALTALSLLGLGLYDYRLPPFLIAFTLAFVGLVRAIRRRDGRVRVGLTAAGLAALLVLFVWNKRAGGAFSVLPSQTGLVLLGVSFLVLKAAAALIETARGTIGEVRVREALAWIAFAPIYPAGPMEALDHFRRQEPVLDRSRALGGLERILFGLVKALVAATYLGQWVEPIVAAPQRHVPLELLLGLYALSLSFYLDFSGYSDIAIGLGALYGYDIEENFDRPFLRRNLVQLWQNWHMTLTRFLRLYLFIPVSRRVMRYASWLGDRAAVTAGQVAAMTFCGLWHELAWGFVLWGLLQALGLVWVGVVCRDLGRMLPVALVGWWRRSPIAYVLSTVITFNAFSVPMIFLVTDVSGALRYLRLLFQV